MTFDGASREVCTARRIRTNTPLQALVTLNDSVYVEASYQLARQMRSKNSLNDQLAFGYESATGQKINKEKLVILERLYSTALKEYQHGNIKLVSSQTQKTELPETKALAMVATAILNLDEFVTKN